MSGSVLLGLIALTGCHKGGGSSSPGPQPGPSSWYSQYRAPTSSNLRAVRAQNPSSLIVAGDATSIFRSDDAGLTWNQIEHLPHSRGGDVAAMDFVGSTLECVGADSNDPTKGRAWDAINGVLDFSTVDLDASALAPDAQAPYTDVNVVSADTLYRLRSDGVVEKVVSGAVAARFAAPTAGTWNGIHFFGTVDTGVIVGAPSGGSYSIYHMTAGGAWVASTVSPAAPPAPAYTLTRVTFPTALIGYACGGNLTVLKTTDGGVSWNLVVTNSSDTRVLHGVHFVSATMGWIVGDQGALGFTNDGGLNFFNQSAGFVEDLNDVFMVDSSNGYVVGNHGLVLRTTNGSANPGATWSRVPPQSIPDSLTNLTAVDFENDGSLGLAAGKGGLLLRTMDGGTSWIPVTSGVPAVDLYGVAVPKAGGGNVGYACGAGGTVVRTTNLKAATPTWTSATPGGANILRAILFPTDDTHGIVCGDGSTLLFTTNGTAWTASTGPTTAATAWLALSSDTGGFNTYVAGTAGISATSANIGNSWANLTTLGGGPPDILAFQSPTSSALFAGATDEVVYRGTALAWSLPNVKPLAGTVPLSLSFVNATTGWTVNSPAPFSGGLFTTTGGGLSWTRQYIHTKWQPRAVWMSPTVSGLGFIVGDSGTILKTTTGGQ